ncbi:hypothetical protein HK102_010907, partial [Quaeritorhiza haematococci]
MEGRRGPSGSGPRNQVAIQPDVPIDHRPQRELVLDPCERVAAQAAGRVGIAEERQQGGGPGLGGRLADQDAGRAGRDEIGIAADAGDDARQSRGHRLQERVAHPLGHAREDEQVAGAEVLGRARHGPDELDAVGQAQRGGQVHQRLTVAPGADEDQIRGRTAGDLDPGVQQERQVLLRVQPAGEDDARAREKIGLDGARAGMEDLGVDAAGRAGQAVGRDAEREPLVRDVVGDGGEVGVAEDRAAEQGGPARPQQLPGLAVVARAGGLDEGRDAPKEGPGQAGGDRFPQGLMGVDHVQLAPEPPEGADEAGDVRDAEERAAIGRPDPAMDLDAPMLLVVDR